MKFYNRKSELAELRRIRDLSFSDHSRLTVVTGRRRIGKTSLIMKAVEDMPTVYLFVGRKSEATLCSEFIPVIGQSLDVFGNTYFPVIISVSDGTVFPETVQSGY